MTTTSLTAPVANAEMLPPMAGTSVDETQSAIPADTTEASSHEKAGESAVMQTPKHKLLKVVFDHLDFDSMLAAWGIRKKRGVSNVILAKVPSGERLPADEAEGFDVEYVDMGGGDCDHHGKGLINSSSFVLAAEKYGFDKDAGMQVLLELSRRFDNAQEIPWDSIAHSVNGLRFHPWFRDPESREIDETKVMEFVFILFDNCYAQTLSRHKTAMEYSKVVQVKRLDNGLWAALLPEPRFRGEAFHRGVDVLVWTSPVDRKKPDGAFTVQIAVSRKSAVDLAPIVAKLRQVEMNTRGVKAVLAKLDMVGVHPQVPGWFLLDPQLQDGKLVHKFVACGTEKHPLPEGHHTKIGRNHIFAVTCSELSMLPKADA